MNTDEYKRLNGNILKVYLIAILAGFAFFYNEIFTLYYLNFSLSFSQISVLLIFAMITTLILEVPSGAFADLYGRKVSMFIGVLFLAFGLSIAALFSTFKIFMIAAIVFGVGMAFISGAYNALIYDSLKKLGREKEYLKITTKEETIFLAIGLISAYFGPYLFSFNVRWPYYISSIAAFIWAISVLTLYEPSDLYKKKLTLKSHYEQMKEGLKFTLNNHKIVWLILFSGLVFLIFYIIANLIYAPYIIELGFTMKQLGIICFVATGIQTLFVFFTDKIEKEIGEKKSLFVIILSLFAVILASYLTKNWFIAIIFGIFWTILSFKELVVENYIHHHLREDNRATVLSIHSMALSVLGIIFVPIFGFIIDNGTLSKTLLMLAIITLVLGSVLLFVRYNNKVWKSLD